MAIFLLELQRRKVYRVGVAYAVVAWLLIQIATQVFPFFDVPNRGVRLVILAIMLGFPIAVTLAWVFDLTPEGIVRTDDDGEIDDTTATRQRRRKGAVLWLVLSLVTLGAYLIAIRIFPHAPDPPAPSNTATMRHADPSVAVLPFVDLSQHRDQEYFSDGISEELVSTLGKIQGLRVAAPTSSLAVSQRHLQSREIGRVLNVANLLQGSVRREGERVRITVELSNAADGFNIWSETYERELGDIFRVQEEIAHAIGDALKVKLAIAGPPQASIDPQAYDLYLQGMFFSNKSDEASLRHSLELFQASLARSPRNARAWSGIAKVWYWLADAYVKPLEADPAMRVAARMALALDPRDTDARVYLGESQRILEHDLVGAEASFRSALRTNPNSAVAHQFLGLLLGAEGFRRSGLAELERARALDPLSPDISNFLAMIYVSQGRYDDAIAESQRLHRLDAGYVYGGAFLGDAYREQGRYALAIDAYKQAERLSGLPEPGLAITYVRMGRLDDARKILASLEHAAATGYYSGDQIATIHAALGDKDAAFHWLQRAFDERSAPLMGLGTRPEFRSLHSDPRYTALLVKLGLDPVRVAAANAPHQ